MKILIAALLFFGTVAVVQGTDDVNQDVARADWSN